MKMIEHGVFILSPDREWTKEISLYLRKLSLIAYIYDTFDELWKAALSEIPKFVIVDVSKISFGERNLLNHPNYLNNLIKLVLSYDQNVYPLYLSSRKHLHFGALKKDRDDLQSDEREQEITQVLEAALKRVSLLEKRDKELDILIKEIDQNKKEISNLKSLIEKNSLNHKSDDGVLSILTHPQLQYDIANEDDYFSQIVFILEKWPHLLNYLVMKWDKESGNLIPLSIETTRCLRNLPKIIHPKLEKEDLQSEHSIEKIIEIAVTTTLPLFKSDCYPFPLIKKDKKNINFFGIIILSSKRDEVWSLQEKKIFTFLLDFLITKKLLLIKNEKVPIWHHKDRYLEPLSLLNIVFNDYWFQEKKVVFYELDLSLIIETIKEGDGHHFRWHDFYHDLIQHFLFKVVQIFSYSHVTLNKIIFVIESLHIKVFEQEMQKALETFSLKNYFKDPMVAESIQLTAGHTLFPDIRRVSKHEDEFFKILMN